MRPSAVHYMLPANPSYGDPLVLFEQKPARKFVATVLIVLLLVLLLLYSPFYMIFTAALADQGLLRETITERPRALIQILAAFGVFLFFIGGPIYFLFDTLTRSRRVQIAQGCITVTERAFGFSKTWQASLLEFKGIKQTVRALLSGVRHELILVHSDPQRSIVLQMSHNPKDIDGINIATQLAVPLISSDQDQLPQNSVKLMRTASV